VSKAVIRKVRRNSFQKFLKLSLFYIFLWEGRQKCCPHRSDFDLEPLLMALVPKQVLIGTDFRRVSVLPMMVSTVRVCECEENSRPPFKSIFLDDWSIWSLSPSFPHIFWSKQKFWYKNVHRHLYLPFLSSLRPSIYTQYRIMVWYIVYIYRILYTYCTLYTYIISWDEDNFN